MPTSYQDVLELLQAIEPDPDAIAQLDAEALPYLESFITPPTHFVPMGTVGAIGEPSTAETIVAPFFDVSLARRATSLAVSIADARALPIARQAAASEYPEVRLAVAAGIWRLAPFGVADMFSTLINDDDGGVRRFALLSVAHIGPGPVLEAIRPQLHEKIKFLEVFDTEPAVRLIAPLVLHRIEGFPLSREDVRRALLNEATLDDVGIAIGPEALPHLVELAGSEHAGEAASAVYLAGKVAGPGGGAAIERGAEHDSSDVRLAAARALARTYRPGDEDVLQRLFVDDEPTVRRMAIASAARLPDSPQVSQLLQTVRQSESEDNVRLLAESVLERRNDSGTSQ